jgi:thiol-disulfide isomerase/thioredoxin
MKKYFQLIIFAGILILLFGACKSDHESFAIAQMDFEEFEPVLYQQNDTVYVINFWATWCAPCVKEIPYFEQLGKEYRDQKVKIILVSLDFPNKLEELVIPFLRENNIQSEVIHLTDVKANTWINKVDKKWSGAIPATVVYKGSSRQFVEGSMDYEEIKSLIKSKL